MFKIILTARARRELKKISRSHRIVIKQILDEIKEDPLLGKSLTRELTDRNSYRVGPYRIIYIINKKENVVVILTAGHRSTVYN